MMLSKWQTKTLAALVLSAMALSAQASRVAGEIVSGTITNIDPPYRISLDGHVYEVSADSPAAHALGKLARGQRVDLVLDGPKTAASSHVTAVLTHSGN